MKKCKDDVKWRKVKEKKYWSKYKQTLDWLIDFDGMPINLGLFHV